MRAQRAAKTRGVAESHSPPRAPQYGPQLAQAAFCWTARVQHPPSARVAPAKNKDPMAGDARRQEYLARHESTCAEILETDSHPNFPPWHTGCGRDAPHPPVARRASRSKCVDEHDAILAWRTRLWVTTWPTGHEDPSRQLLKELRPGGATITPTRRVSDHSLCFAGLPSAQANIFRTGHRQVAKVPEVLVDRAHTHTHTATGLVVALPTSPPGRNTGVGNEPRPYRPCAQANPHAHGASLAGSKPEAVCPQPLDSQPQTAVCPELPPPFSPRNPSVTSAWPGSVSLSPAAS